MPAKKSIRKALEEEVDPSPAVDSLETKWKANSVRITKRPALEKAEAASSVEAPSMTLPSKRSSNRIVEAAVKKLSNCIPLRRID